MISGIPLMLGLGTRMSDPYVYVASWAPSVCRSFPDFWGLSPGPQVALERSDKFVRGDVPDPWRNHSCG